MPRYYFHLTGGKQVLNNHKGIDLSGNAATPYAASGRCPIDNIFSFADSGYRMNRTEFFATTRAWTQSFPIGRRPAHQLKMPGGWLSYVAFGLRFE